MHGAIQELRSRVHGSRARGHQAARQGAQSTGNCCRGVEVGARQVASLDEPDTAAIRAVVPISDYCGTPGEMGEWLYETQSLDPVVDRDSSAELPGRARGRDLADRLVRVRRACPDWRGSPRPDVGR